MIHTFNTFFAFFVIYSTFRPSSPASVGFLFIHGTLLSAVLARYPEENRISTSVFTESALRYRC